jgi:hypothetical protein
MRSLIGSIIVGMSLALPAGFAGGEETPPLPPGHPQLPTASQPALPAGHPKLPAEDTPALPPGHPQVPGNNQQPAAGNLPAGHPTVTRTKVQPGGKGAINVKVVQGTKGGPAVASEAVTIEYYNAQGEVVARSTGKLGAKADFSVRDIPLETPVQPLVTVTHAGIPYRMAGSVMEAQSPERDLELPVYEATDQEPAWEVRMRHVIVEPSAAGLGVTEMISVFNPADRAWTGKAGADKKKVTLSLTLPAGANDVKLVSAPNDGAFAERKLGYTAALVPGGTDLQIHYVLPAKNDAAEVTLVAPAATGSLFVFLPDDGTTFTSEKLTKVEVKPGAKLRANSRFYTAAPQKAGETVSFKVSGLAGAKPAAAGTPSGEDDLATNEPAAPVAPAGTPQNGSDIPGVAKVVAGAGAAVIVATGVAFVLFKGPRTDAGGSR